MGKYYFGTRSKNNLGNVRQELIELAQEVLDLGLFDFGITCGAREKEEQEKLFFEGRTKVRYPNSKHNVIPGDPEREKACAFDFVLYVNGKATYEKEDLPSYYMAIGVFIGIAAKKGIKIRCGGDWDGDFDVKDQSFHDLPHVELILD